MLFVISITKFEMLILGVKLIKIKNLLKTENSYVIIVLLENEFYIVPHTQNKGDEKNENIN